MHAGTDLRLIKCFDGLQYSFEILEHVYAGLHPACFKIGSDESALTDALWKCWSIIDVVHRIREISLALPGLSKKNCERQRFIDATDLAEKYRHYIQHLRSELLHPEIRPFPVWGSLAWVDEKDNFKSHLVIIGAQIEGTSYSGCVFDTHSKKWVSKVCLGIDGKSLNIDPMYDACAEFKAFVLPWILETFKIPINNVPAPPILTMTIQLVPKAVDQKS